MIGLRIERAGFPLEIGCYEANTAETTTIIPIITVFQQQHGLADIVMVMVSGMLSAAILTALDEAGLRFIVGSRAGLSDGLCRGWASEWRSSL